MDLFYERRYKSLENREVHYILNHNLSDDGGTWNMLVNLINKYGIVPKSVMRDTYHSKNTFELNVVLYNINLSGASPPPPPLLLTTTHNRLRPRPARSERVAHADCRRRRRGGQSLERGRDHALTSPSGGDRHRRGGERGGAACDRGGGGQRGTFGQGAENRGGEGTKFKLKFEI